MAISIDIFSALSALKNPEQLTKEIAECYVNQLHSIDEKRMRESLNECEADVREEYVEIFENNIHFSNGYLCVGKRGKSPIKSDEAKAVAKELHRIIGIIQRIGKILSPDDAITFSPIKKPPYREILEYLIKEGVVSQMDISIFVEHIKKGLLSGLVKGRNKTKMVFCAYRLSRFFPEEWRNQVIIDLEIDKEHFSNNRVGEYYKNFPI